VISSPIRKPIAAPSVILALAVAISLASARADVITGGNVRVAFTGTTWPKALPRRSPRPVALRIAATVTALGARRPPALRRFRIAFNRHAHLSLGRLPVCPRRRLQGRTTSQALAVCGDALLGDGRFSAHIDIPEQAPFPARGHALLFNSSLHGRPALLAHIYGRRPLPTIEILTLSVGHDTRPGYRVTLSATLPDVGDEWGYVTGFMLTLRREAGDGTAGPLSANCPAPAGIAVVPFRLAFGEFQLSDGTARDRALGATCRAR
jgi:hypothetical protein